jgi:hypothetical protein
MYSRLAVFKDQILQTGFGLELADQIVRRNAEGKQLAFGVAAEDAPCRHGQTAEGRGLCWGG